MKVSSSVVLEAENFSNDVSFVSEEFPRDFKRKRAIGPLGFRTLNKKNYNFSLLGKNFFFYSFYYYTYMYMLYKDTHHIIITRREFKEEVKDNKG